MTESSEILIDKSSGKKKVLFAFPRIGSSLVLGMEGFALFNLYYTGYGLSALLVTIAQAIGFVVIGFGQFLMGWLSDGKYTKWGRRKPYIISFAPLLGISFIFLFLPTLILPDLVLLPSNELSPNSETMLFVWFLIWDILFKISYSMTTVYQSWMAEQFVSSERPKVSQFQNYFNWIGNGSMALVSILVLTSYVEILSPPAPALPNPNAPIPLDFLIFVFAFGIIAIIAFLFVGILMPTEPKFEIKTSLKENLKIVLKNRNYLLVTLMIGIASLAWSILNDALLAYNQAALFLTGIDFYIIAGVLIIGIFSFLYIWRRILEKRGKKNALLNIFLFAAIFLPISLLALVEAIPRLIIGILFVVIATGALGGWYLIPYIIYADIAEDDKQRTGQLKAGVYAGFNSIFLNLFQAFGVFVLGVAIDNLPIISLTSGDVALGLIVFGPICSIILLIAYFYTKKYVKLDFDWERKK
ncbi:MAG: MFS transporter [Promethearchaeota archaeon]|nr:MAG: MFS transporter [Candidatus Lokiarchaeota archaeon]